MGAMKMDCVQCRVYGIGHDHRADGNDLLCRNNTIVVHQSRFT